MLLLDSLEQLPINQKMLKFLLKESLFLRHHGIKYKYLNKVYRMNGSSFWEYLPSVLDYLFFSGFYPRREELLNQHSRKPMKRNLQVQTKNKKDLDLIRNYAFF